MRTCENCGLETPATIDELIRHVESGGKLAIHRDEACWECEAYEHHMALKYLAEVERKATVATWLLLLSGAAAALLLMVYALTR